MRIAHIYKTFLPEDIGGCERVIQTISHFSSNKGHFSKILTSSKRPSFSIERANNIEIYRYPRLFELASCPISSSMLFDFKNQLKNVDIVHYHFPWPFADLLHIFYKVKKPSIVTYHSDIVRQKLLKKIYNPLMNKFLDSANILVSTSANLAQTSTVLCRYQDKTKIIPIGINYDYRYTADPKIVSQYKSQFGDSFVLFIGVLRYYKGLEFLLDAVKNSNLKLVIAGSGPEEIYLKKKARKLHLSNVFFLGEVSEKEKYALLEACCTVVVPSHLRSEAFSLTLLEGLMFGKPIVSTRLGTGTTYVNVHNVTGFTVEPENPDQLRDALISLTTNKKLALAFGEAAKKRYLDHFNGDQMAKSYLEIYTDLYKSS